MTLEETPVRGATGRGGDSRGSAVARCIREIRGMLLRQELLPGVQIRQADMAERLRTSTIPIREALKALATEGILTHAPNQGYFVAVLRQSELDQIYTMRRLLEGLLLETLEWPDREQLEAIRTFNDDLATASGGRDIEVVVGQNRAFHFAMFDLSPLNVVRQEVKRLWDLSDAYRAVYLYDVSVHARIVNEHGRIIRALEQQDREALVTAADDHRSGLGHHLASVLR